MAYYLLTWNPQRYPWDSISEAADEVAEQGFHRRQWSCGNTKQIKEGDRVFLLRQGAKPRGIIATGAVLKAPYQAQHWDSERDKQGLYIDVELHTLQDPETDAIIPRRRLDDPEFSDVHWDTQRSGISIPEQVALALEEEWTDVVELNITPRDKLQNGQKQLREGAARAVTLNIYERNPEARHRCIDHYGKTCAVCSFDFEEAYGEIAKGYIHVHHLKPVATLGENHEVDPIEDLRPVCPNCHAVIHMESPPYTIEQVQEMLQA